MALTAESFIAKFPEFEDRVDEEIIDALIEQVYIETDGYPGLSTEAKQTHATALHTAFLLDNQYPATTAINAGLGAIKRLENFNEKVEFAINNIDSGDFNSNRYGQRLKLMLDGEYSGGFYV